MTQPETSQQARLSNNISRTIKKEILSLIIKYGRFTIPDIVDRTGISPSTVSKYVFDMQNEGTLVAFDTIKTERRGRRPILYGMKEDMGYFVGVDIKHDALSMGLMDISGKLVKTSVNDNFLFENTYSKLEEICSAVEAFISEITGTVCKKISGICFDIGGRVNTYRGTSASHFNFEEFQGSSLTDFLESRLGCRVFIENDTKAMTYAEYLALKDKDIRNMMYINIGWGLGLGMVIEGKLLRGHMGYAGELGHIPFYDNNVICHCGKKGCIETEVSGNAVYRKLMERIRKGENSILTPKVLRGESITIKDILFAAEKEDPLCVDLISSMGSELGRHVAGMINIFNPQCIVVGGTFAKAASYYFLYPMRDAIRKYALKLICNDVSVIPSKMGEEAGVFGTCMIARNNIFNEIFS